MELKRIEVEYHHEDRGNCLATFRGIGKDAKKWFNKMEDGTWYYTYPSKGYFENSHEVKGPCVFLIYGKNLAKPFAIDSNVPGYATKPYVFKDKIIAELRDECLRLPGSIDYEEWKDAMCDCDSFRSYKGYHDNFLHYEVETIGEIHVGNFSWAGRHHEVVKSLCRNKISGRKYYEYLAHMTDVGASAYAYDEHLTVYSFQVANSPSKT